LILKLFHPLFYYAYTTVSVGLGRKLYQTIYSIGYIVLGIG
jgi:hypothetical protein